MRTKVTQKLFHEMGFQPEEEIHDCSSEDSNQTEHRFLDEPGQKIFSFVEESEYYEL